MNIIVDILIFFVIYLIIESVLKSKLVSFFKDIYHKYAGIYYLYKGKGNLSYAYKIKIEDDKDIHYHFYFRISNSPFYLLEFCETNNKELNFRGLTSNVKLKDDILTFHRIENLVLYLITLIPTDKEEVEKEY